MPEVFIMNGANGPLTLQGVCSEQRGLICAITTQMREHAARFHRLAFTMLFQKTPTAANDCFLYIKNEMDGHLLVFESLSLRLGGSGQTEQVEIKIDDTGTSSGGTTTTPVNSYVGSEKIADGTFETGVDITGLSGGSVVERIYIASSNTSTLYDLRQTVVVPKNKTLTLYAVTGGNEIDGTINFFFHESCGNC